MPKIRRVPIDTHPENTAFLLRDGEGYSPEQYQALRKIRVFDDAHEILATLNIVEDEEFVGHGEIGLGEQAFRRLGCTEGTEVAIEQARPPKSLESVHRKVSGDTLADSEIAAIVRDVAAHLYSPMEIGAFLVACAGFMSTQETLSLTRSMVEAGRGYARALELLASGAALAAMERIIEAQGRRAQPPALGRHSFDVVAPARGTVQQIDCERIARIARLAGAPMDEGAGIDLFCKVGAHVRAGETIYRIYVNSDTGLGFARDLAAERCGYEVAP